MEELFEYGTILIFEIPQKITGIEMTLMKRNFDAPDTTQNPPMLRIDTVKMGNSTFIRHTYQPGWRWSKHIKPAVGTKSCQVHHMGIFVSGRMWVRTDDGQEIEFGPGDVADIPPGHDGWVVGDEPSVLYVFAPG